MPDTAKTPSRRPGPVARVTAGILGLITVIVLLLVIFWDWDWFVPLVNRQATAALGRPTTITHLHVSPGLNTVVTVDDLTIAQPEDFKDEKADFAHVDHLTVAVKVWHYIVDHDLEFPRIVVDTPTGNVIERSNGQKNFVFKTGSGSSSSSSTGTKLPKIDRLTITDGKVHVAFAPLKADMQLRIHTTPPTADSDGTIVVDADGHYAKAPITGHLEGGAPLALTNPSRPYPIDGRIANGRTVVTLKGTVNDPLHFAGTNVKLHFSGPDMALLFPLTGVPIPHTPPYSVTGNLDYTADHIRFHNFEGKMGHSDIGGDIAVNPHTHPPDVIAKLHSHRVDLADLGGFIGSTPGKTAPAKTRAASDHVLPDQKINVPKLNAVNAHLIYTGDHIENHDLPLDNIDVEADVRDGAIILHKLNFAVGSGRLEMAAKLTPAPHEMFATSFKLDASRLDVSRLMQATGVFKGRGTLGGHVTLASTGNSIANLVANGNGGITMVIDQGGNLSALLPDLLGLKLGSALLSALGIPNRSQMQCFIANMPLKHGVLHTDSLLLQTDATRTTGDGTVNFRTDKIDYSVTTRALHFNVLSLPGAVNINGPITDPNITPGAELAGRTAAAIGLGILFPPAALIPTIQFGVGKGSACESALNQADTRPAAGIAPGSTAGGHKRSAAGKGHTGAHKASAAHGKTSLSPTQIHKKWEKRLDAQH